MDQARSNLSTPLIRAPAKSYFNFCGFSAAINRALVVLVLRHFGTVLVVPALRRSCKASVVPVLRRSP